mmetsp:Transcript_15612/g.53273  ORF Transcript_15612/g.53273 Transcript_15612/m.53273 type:complete len:240 (+) Transcript_15612:3-722(+)
MGASRAHFIRRVSGTRPRNAPMRLSFVLAACLVAPAWPLAARTTSTHFTKKSSLIEFGGKMVMDEAILMGSSSELSDFLTPDRVIRAAWDPRNIEALPGGLYRLTQEPFDFVVVKVKNFVDVAISQEEDGLIVLESRGITVFIEGLRPQKLDVQLSLRGSLEPPRSSAVSSLKGGFNFSAKGTLVGPLLFVPEVALRVATTAINTGIIVYARDRLLRGIKRDFAAWRVENAAAAAREAR